MGLKLSDQLAYRKPNMQETAVMEVMNSQIINLAKSTEMQIKPSAERTLAMRKLQEFRMWLNCAVLMGGIHDSESCEAEHGS